MDEETSNVNGNDLAWRRSTRCEGGACLEVAFSSSDQRVAVRDSKDLEGPILWFSLAQWRDFIDSVRENNF